MPTLAACGRLEMSSRKVSCSEAADGELLLWCHQWHRSVRFESGAMATLRFGCQSHRQVVLVSAQLVLDFLREEAARSEDGGDGGSISHASAVAWLTHAGQEALDGFTSAHPGMSCRTRPCALPDISRHVCCFIFSLLLLHP